MLENQAVGYRPPDNVQPYEVRLHPKALSQMEQNGFTKEQIEASLNTYVTAASFLDLAGIPQVVTTFASTHFPEIPQTSFDVRSDFQFFPALSPQGKHKIYLMTMADIFFSTDDEYVTRVSAGLLNDTHMWGFFGRRKYAAIQDFEVAQRIMKHSADLSFPLQHSFVPGKTMFGEARFLANNELTKMYEATPKIRDLNPA